MPYKDKIFDAFRRQRRDAIRLKRIEFLFTFEEWVNWWEDHLGSQWFKRRGQKRGQYVMARFGDKGPYASWNVECKLAEDNCSDRAKNGSSAKGSVHGRTKLTDQDVISIFISDDPQTLLAARYGVSVSAIHRIRRGRYWSHITGPLSISVARR